jgi:hypothetical protein
MNISLIISYQENTFLRKDQILAENIIHITRSITGRYSKLAYCRPQPNCTYIHTYINTMLRHTSQHVKHSCGDSKKVGISPENGFLANHYALGGHRPGEATQSTYIHTYIYTYIHTFEYANTYYILYILIHIYLQTEAFNIYNYIEYKRSNYSYECCVMYICMNNCMYVLYVLYVLQGTDSYSVTRRVTLSLMLQLLTAISSVCSDKDATQLKQLAQKLLVRP